MVQKMFIETEENPKMFQIYLNQAWHEVFCYGFAYERRDSGDDKLLFALLSGNDSALQSIKSAVDIGVKGGLAFGYGVKNNVGYQFKSEKRLVADKGQYDKFPMTLTRNRKGIAIVHDDVLNNSQYVLSMDGQPHEDIATLLGGDRYGLHILPEWRETVLSELIKEKYLVEHEVYVDKNVFPHGLKLYSIDLSEEQADHFISRLIKQKKLSFSAEGTGNSISQTQDLTEYLLANNDAMVKKLSETVKPDHNPLFDEALSRFDEYTRQLFPVQAHAATAVVKRLKKQKAVIVQGEMSTGKSAMMTAMADGFTSAYFNGKSGYHVCLMCPPSLTKKWPEEIKALMPEAKVIVVKQAKTLITYHREWVAAGKPVPAIPTFFIISFKTMSLDASIVPAISYQEQATGMQKTSGASKYRSGFYCTNCGQPHQTIENKITQLDSDGNENEVFETHNMTPGEFGTSRRITNSTKPANAFCFHCGDSLWTKTVPNRFKSFKDWTGHEKRLLHAIEQSNQPLVRQIQTELPSFPKAVGKPRRIAVIEYIRRKMKLFFDLTIVDEIHELKAGMSAQGNALGSLVRASKKVVTGTGTLFGGKAGDIYYLLWRLFPTMMVESGYEYKDVLKFNYEYGNVEETIVELKSTGKEYSNSSSRGGTEGVKKKIVPGISPYIFGRYLIQNVINVRLKDVWPDPVDLVDTPTIFVPMDEPLRIRYEKMIQAFQTAISKDRTNGHRLYMPMTDYGIAFPDNPFTFPDATYKTELGNRQVIWEADHLDTDLTLNKEKKLQEIIQTEMAENRKSIVYVRDTGSSVSERDLRPRLKQKLEDIGAKVCVLDTSTTSTDSRSEWLKHKIETEEYDVCIVSQELVKVGLDLLCTPTLIYYQFSWSLFTINQSARRAWRIGQTEECRLFYLAYEDSYQEKMAEIIAQKNRATAAINGEVSTDGLSAMLGDEGDLQSMLIESVKNGGKVLKGSAEDWIGQSSDRARELLASIGKQKQPRVLNLEDQFKRWVEATIEGEQTKLGMIKHQNEILSNIKANLVKGFEIKNDVLKVDLVNAFGFDPAHVADGAILFHLVKTLAPPKAKQTIKPEETVIKPFKNEKKKSARRGKTKTSENQMTLDLFG